VENARLTGTTAEALLPREAAEAPLPREASSVGLRPRARIAGGRFALGALGFVLFAGAWYVLVAAHVWRFDKLPDPLSVAREWFSPNPVFGTSLFTASYYADIWASLVRVLAAFALAVLLGLPFGIVLGWNRTLREFLFPLVELLRPIPPLAWVPLAVLALPGQEPAMIFLTWIAAFFATVLNTMLAVASVDETHLRAAACLGARPLDVLRHVIVPSSLPFIFTGLQIAMGTAWFSLVAAEMIAGQAGLGYLTLNSYQQLQTTTIVIAMGTLGILGFFSSYLVRRLGRTLAAWQAK
jgi:NitT/TauT family transport system permease protein